MKVSELWSLSHDAVLKAGLSAVDLWDMEVEISVPIDQGPVRDFHCPIRVRVDFGSDMKMSGVIIIDAGEPI